jgi:HAD superfamily hydrolase (TIGR01549 family)
MKAVVFDLDGTLLDVREAFYCQFEALTAEFDGKPLSRAQIAASAHGTTEEIIRTLVQNRDVPFDDICKRHTELRHEAYDQSLALYAGVDELLPILKNMGVKVAALTAGNHMTVECLERLGIHHHFDTVVSADHVTHAKPHPEGLELIFDRLGVQPHEVVMVGDSVVDVLVGKNAGVGKTIGVGHGFGHVDALRLAGADHIVTDIPSVLDVLWGEETRMDTQASQPQLSLAGAGV